MVFIRRTSLKLTTTQLVERFSAILWNSMVIIIIILNLRTAAFKAYCAICVRRSNFRHQASPRVLPSESTHRRKVELWARNVL